MPCCQHAFMTLCGRDVGVAKLAGGVWASERIVGANFRGIQSLYEFRRGLCGVARLVGERGVKTCSREVDYVCGSSRR